MWVKLSAHLVAAAQPRDFIEELLARDVIDLSWEIPLAPPKGRNAKSRLKRGGTQDIFNYQL